ncbi:MAG: hypothetical protein QNL04_05295 [SAR324 cluster bacterium]|nr:hypothetical protein [SAR324 cluster bacterium]
MQPKQSKELNGLTVVQKVGPFVEVFFNFEKLPKVDTSKERLLLEVKPKNALINSEWVVPNGEGPIFLNLKEGQDYHFNLYVGPHPAVEVASTLESTPQVDVFFEHSTFIKLVWGGIDLQKLHKAHEDFFQLNINGTAQQSIDFWGQPLALISGRPESFSLDYCDENLFTVTTNLDRAKKSFSLDFSMAEPKRTSFLSPAVHSERLFRVRAELPRFWGMDQWLLDEAKKLKFNDKSALIGGWQFVEEGKETHFIRQSGVAIKIDDGVIEQILKNEHQIKKPIKVTSYKLELQVTSAHRELFKHRVLERELSAKQANPILSLESTDLELAQTNLFETHPLVDWESSFVEVVGFFELETESGHWQEFKREPAHVIRWDYLPSPATKEIKAKWVFFDLHKPEIKKSPFETNSTYRNDYPPKVVLKPFSDKQLLAWWDLEQTDVEKIIEDHWKCGLNEVGFYLKIHEEFLGDRKGRPDLECHIHQLFTPWQNLYITVEPNRCFAAEIVARKGDAELALTPISKGIVTPRPITESSSEMAGPRGFQAHWHHPSQREVTQANGKDSQNQAKVMLHLHMHSPNLFRAEQFREAFLKPTAWPIQDKYGSEVHNPPGEWALKNCFDSWLRILKLLFKLKEDGVDYQLSLDITPPVAYMISHPRFKDYLSRYLLRIKTHAQGVIALMKSKMESPDYIWAAEKYLDDILDIENFYHNVIGKDMIAGFRTLENEGFIEISTCTATHGMPANLESMTESLDAQLAMASMSHNRIFGREPKGIWLAENSCFPGVEDWMDKRGLHYYFVEAEAVLSGEKGLSSEEFNPTLASSKPVVAFGRSRMGRVQVWDAEIGYAGHPDFREYHHRHWGLPLKRITSKTSEEKHPYNPDNAKAKAQEMARDFHEKLMHKADEAKSKGLTAEPLITCSYDAELFGHHWYEGPWFLEELLREFYRSSVHIGLTTPSHYLKNIEALPVSTPNPSTWGHEAQHSKWNAPQVAWAQRELERADGLLNHYVAKVAKGELSGIYKDYVLQMSSDLLRATSSDLTFVIMSGDFVEDMQREILKYLDYFYRLKSLIDSRIEDPDFLAFRGYENDMFFDISGYYGF